MAIHTISFALGDSSFAFLNEAIERIRLYFGIEHRSEVLRLAVGFAINNNDDFIKFIKKVRYSKLKEIFAEFLEKKWKEIPYPKRNAIKFAFKNGKMSEKRMIAILEQYNYLDFDQNGMYRLKAKD